MCCPSMTDRLSPVSSFVARVRVQPLFEDKTRADFLNRAIPIWALTSALLEKKEKVEITKALSPA